MQLVAGLDEGPQPIGAAVQLLGVLRRANVVTAQRPGDCGPKAVDGVGVIEGFCFAQVGWGLRGRAAAPRGDRALRKLGSLLVGCAPSAPTAATPAMPQAAEGGLPPGRCIRLTSAPRGCKRAVLREVSVLLLALAGRLQGAAHAEALPLLAERRLAARAAWRAGHPAAVLDAAAGAGAAASRGLGPGADPPVQATRWDAIWWFDSPAPLDDADAAERRAVSGGVLRAAPASVAQRPDGALRRALQAALDAAGVAAPFQRWWFGRLRMMVRGRVGGDAWSGWGAAVVGPGCVVPWLSLWLPRLGHTLALRLPRVSRRRRPLSWSTRRPPSSSTCSPATASPSRACTSASSASAAAARAAAGRRARRATRAARTAAAACRRARCSGSAR
jgi:hypothetical protein